MESLKSQLQRMRGRLAALSMAHRVFAGAAAAVAVVIVLIWMRAGWQRPMEAILDQPFAADEITRIAGQLKTRGINHKVVGDRILVAADRRGEVLAELAYSQLLPRDTKNGIDEIIRAASPWTGPTEKKELWNRAKEATLAGVLRNFPGVAHAMVMIDNTERRDFSGGIQPSATVNLQMRPGSRADSRLVNAAADLVSGAVANLAKARVKVIADGVSCSTTGGSALADRGLWLEQTQAAERYFSRKLTEQLAFIPRVMVSVRVEHGHPRPVQAASEPSAADAAAPAPPWEPPSHAAQTAADDQAARITGASVFVPRSYFAEIFRRRNPSVRDPDDTALQPLIDAQLVNIRTTAKACLGLEEDRLITVAPYIDLLNAGASEPSAADTTGVFRWLPDYSREVTMVALVLAGLLAASAVLRRAGGRRQAQAVVPAYAEAHDPQTQHMIHQARVIARDDPDTVAKLINRWLDQP